MKYEEIIENKHEMREKERERAQWRRRVKRFLREFVSVRGAHLSDRPLTSTLATLSDRHCQVIIIQALHLTHTQTEAGNTRDTAGDKRKMRCRADVARVRFRQFSGAGVFLGISLSPRRTRSLEDTRTRVRNVLFALWTEGVRTRVLLF